MYKKILCALLMSVVGNYSDVVWAKKNKTSQLTGISHIHVSMFPSEWLLNNESTDSIPNMTEKMSKVLKDVKKVAWLKKVGCTPNNKEAYKYWNVPDTDELTKYNFILFEANVDKKGTVDLRSVPIGRAGTVEKSHNRKGRDKDLYKIKPKDSIAILPYVVDSNDQAKVKKIIIPEGVRFISDRAFGGCSNVEDVYLPTTFDYEQNTLPFPNNGKIKFHPCSELEPKRGKEKEKLERWIAYRLATDYGINSFESQEKKHFWKKK